MTRISQLLLVLLCLLVSVEALAVDSYRYLHVTIDTPWAIFIFLLPMVLAPFILMAILYWRFAKRRADTDTDEDEELEDDMPGHDGVENSRRDDKRSSDNG